MIFGLCVLRLMLFQGAFVTSKAQGLTKCLGCLQVGNWAFNFFSGSNKNFSANNISIFNVISTVSFVTSRDI